MKRLRFSGPKWIVLGCSQVVKAAVSKTAIVGSIPTSPAILKFLIDSDGRIAYPSLHDRNSIEWNLVRTGGQYPASPPSALV